MTWEPVFRTPFLRVIGLGRSWISCSNDANLVSTPSDGEAWLVYEESVQFLELNPRTFKAQITMTVEWALFFRG